MKVALQYLNDSEGNTQAVLLPINDWEKLLSKLNKYEQALKLKSDIKEALNQVAAIRKKGSKKSTLKDFLNEI